MLEDDTLDRMKLASELAMRRARRILDAMKRLMEAEARILNKENDEKKEESPPVSSNSK